MSEVNPRLDTVSGTIIRKGRDLNTRQDVCSGCALPWVDRTVDSDIRALIVSVTSLVWSMSRTTYLEEEMLSRQVL